MLSNVLPWFDDIGVVHIWRHTFIDPLQFFRHVTSKLFPNNIPPSSFKSMMPFLEDKLLGKGLETLWVDDLFYEQLKKRKNKILTFKIAPG